MTMIDGFYNKECKQIDATCVNAFFELGLSEENPTELFLDNSWGKTSVDLLPAIKAGETMTYLKLSPAANPEYLEYDPENGIPQCIHGDDLSRIISMTKLKDVNQNYNISDGDVYMWDESSQSFKPFDLKTFVNNTNSAINILKGQVTNLQNAVAQIQEQLRRPDGIPEDTRLAWGNRNIYADYTNTNKKIHGVFTHNTNNNLADDQYFA